jgi:tRNA modification GTPase
LWGGAPGVERGPGGTTLRISAKTGAGVDLLRAEICRLGGWEGHAESTYLARERHLRALRAAAEHLGRAAEELPRHELFAEELRLAHRALAEITGEFSADDLLGEIFSHFCIGK